MDFRNSWVRINNNPFVRTGKEGRGGRALDISCDERRVEDEEEAQVEGGVVVTDMTNEDGGAERREGGKKMTREISFPEQERESDALSGWAKKVRRRRRRRRSLPLPLALSPLFFC